MLFTKLVLIQKQNPCLREQTGILEFNLDDYLLSHGETPHYHRRCIVSLLSSGRDQVVPTLYGRQAILFEWTFSVVLTVLVDSN